MRPARLLSAGQREVDTSCSLLPKLPRVTCSNVHWTDCGSAVESRHCCWIRGAPHTEDSGALLRTADQARFIGGVRVEVTPVVAQPGARNLVPGVPGWLRHRAHYAPVGRTVKRMFGGWSAAGCRRREGPQPERRDALALRRAARRRRDAGPEGDMNRPGRSGSLALGDLYYVSRLVALPQMLRSPFGGVDGQNGRRAAPLQGRTQQHAAPTGRHLEPPARRGGTRRSRRVAQAANGGRMTVASTHVAAVADGDAKRRHRA